MSKPKIHQDLLRAWLRYHRNATLSQVEAAKQRIAGLLEAA